MAKLLSRYYQWLHEAWPAGLVEKLPTVGEDGKTGIPGVRVVGDLGGVPLLKFSSDTGARAVHATLAEPGFQSARGQGGAEVDLAIIGGGVSGISAAIEAKKAGLSYLLLEASQPFSTVANFPVGKPIFTYPTEMEPAGGIRYSEKSQVRESLLADMQAQADEAGIETTQAHVDHISRQGDTIHVHRADGQTTKATRCIIAIGRSGNYRKLDVPGEELDKVSNRLHDPKEFSGQQTLVIGGGDSAAEAAIALAECGSHVTLSYRKPELTRPKPENVDRLQELAQDTQKNLDLDLGTQVVRIDETTATLADSDGERQLPNQATFAMIGREASLDFFRRSGIPIAGERNTKWWATAALMFLLMAFVYQWKKGGTWLKINEWASSTGLFPFKLEGWWRSLGETFNDPSTLPGTLAYVVGDPGFWYSLAYCTIIVVFGLRRIARRKTPYVTRQTITLAAIQVVPLFLLPYLLFPYLGFNGAFDSGFGKWFADEFFPAVDYGSGREYWRAFGLVLAWPLFIWNIFTDQPMWGWLALSFLQTFVLIPLIVRRWGKGAYCGWICSCGALAETLGDAHRHKMPHGPAWTKVNMVGQVFLWLAFAILAFRLLAWAHVPWVKDAYQALLYGAPGSYIALPWSYVWFVDLLWAGILGVAFYFHLSGRVWCRFACPLAALMHLYARVGKFRIFADKKKCISCNVCTSVCHQGIDIMNFANKGAPMEDPQCVRCSACVQQCPTGVLSFGRLDKDGTPILDRLPASPVQIREATKP